MRRLQIASLAMVIFSTAQAQPAPWDAAQAKDQAKGVVKFLAKAEADLRYAVSVGDSDGIFKYIELPLSRIHRAWVDQRTDLQNAAAIRYERCLFASVDFLRYTDTFRKPESLSNRNEREYQERTYRSDLKLCNAAIQGKP